MNTISIYKTNEEITKTVLKNIISIMIARKFIKQEEKDMNLKKLTESNNGKKEYSLKLLTGNSLKLKIIDSAFDSLTKNIDVKSYIDKVNAKVDVIILVVSEIVKTALKKLGKTHPNVEVFREDRLLSDILTSIYSPKYEVLTKEEKESVCSEFRIKDSNFPMFSKNDPVVKWFNAKPGDLFRIFRNSKEVGISISYRIVGNNDDKDLEI